MMKSLYQNRDSSYLAVIKSILRKYPVLLFIAVILQIMVVIAVFVHSFGYTNNIAKSLFDIINNWTITLSIFKFMSKWAVAFSAFTFCLVLVALYDDFRKYRRKRALKRIHTWSRNWVIALADYCQKDPEKRVPLSVKYEDIRKLLDDLKVNHHSMMSDARILRGGLDDTMKKSIYILLLVIDEKLEKMDETIYEDLRALHYNMAEVMIFTFESIQNEKNIRLLFQRNQ